MITLSYTVFATFTISAFTLGFNLCAYLNHRRWKKNFDERWAKLVHRDTRAQERLRR